LAKIWVSKGNALLKLHRDANAIDAYNRSVALSSNPGRALFNVCATYYNLYRRHIRLFCLGLTGLSFRRGKQHTCLE